MPPLTIPSQPSTSNADAIPDNLVEAFLFQVQKSPKACAIIDKRRSISYEELDRLSDTIACTFPAHSGRIGLVMDHGIEMIASMWAILKVGAAYVPTEPNFPRRRIQYIMHQSESCFIVTQQQYSHLFEDLPLVFIEEGFVADERSLNQKWFSSSASDSLAYVLYTSGTTGRPKGVAVEHRNICNYVRAYCSEFNPSADDVMLQNSVCSFDIFVEEVFTCLLSGGTLAIPDALTRSDVSLLMQFADETQVSIISGFPHLLWKMNKIGALPKRLRLLISGGDVLKANYVSELIDNVAIYNTYGPTETTVCATYFQCNNYTPLENNTYPIGRAIKDVTVQLLDSNLEPVEPGEIGEICISGKGVSRGYLDPAESAKSFVFLEKGIRIYRSGDLGRELPDGNIAFVKRNDEQVMIFGKRVEPKEVEFVLEANDAVEHAVVISTPDEDGFNHLTAYLVGSSQGGATDILDALSLYEHMGQQLPDYMIPEFLVELEEIPLTPNGKIDKRALSIALKEAAAHGIPYSPSNA